jgi:GntR family transcriptional regulator, transcriptional repressor for pyruvate dehydrogenase complex
MSQRADGRRAYTDVTTLILERLRAGEWPAGTRLPAERQLAQDLGVSRPTVREALAALELAGVVETRVGVGSYATDRVDDGAPPRADASPAEILETRILLEPRVARLAAERWSRRSLAAIRRPVVQLERDAAAGSGRHPGDLDRQFHAAVAGAAGNAVLARIAGPMWELMTETLWRRLKERSWDAAHTARVAAEHRDIVDAIAVRDRDLAEFLMEAHLRRVVGELFG